MYSLNYREELDSLAASPVYFLMTWQSFNPAA